MSKPLKCKAVVTFDGTEIMVGTMRLAGISSGEAIDLYRSLKANLKRIKKNAKLWGEDYWNAR